MSKGLGAEKFYSFVYFSVNMTGFVVQKGGNIDIYVKYVNTCDTFLTQNILCFLLKIFIHQVYIL